MNKKHFAAMAIAAGLAAACTNTNDQSKNMNKRSSFLDLTARDTTIKPGDDFFGYANGTWIKNTEIPGDQRGWGSFFTLFQSNQTNLRQILDSISKSEHTAGSLEQKVADFYYSGMDTVAIEKAGFDPIKPLLAKIDAVSTPQALLQLLAEGQKDGDGALLNFYIGPDDKNSSKNIVQFFQTGLGMPNRDYYFKTDADSKKIREEYQTYIAKLLTLTGTDSVQAKKDAETILKLETEIAKAHSTPVELRDPDKNYNKFSVDALNKMAPNLDISGLFAATSVKTDTVLVGQPKYITALNSLIKSQPIDAWKKKIRFDMISGHANELSSPFVLARFNFSGKVLNGLKVQQPRWKQTINATDGGLGELLGQIYVKQYFSPAAKEQMLTLVNNLQTVYKSRIEKLDWMSAETKTKALDKLQSFTKKIGYPDKWQNYDDVTISRGDYYANNRTIDRHEFNRSIAKLGKPVDRSEWGMTPPTVNAYYNPPYNEIVFPAGILQFPFFDKDADDAVNYGAIGAVIGHEMTHGFDDQGSKYDKDGNLKDWWTKEDGVKFKEKTDRVVKQYDGYTVLNDLHVNGALTLGENLADIGGLAIAYEAFKLTPQGKSEEKIDGLTPDQRFFLGFSQVWRIKSSDASMRNRILTDPHSPEQYRVNGTVTHMPAFYEAFNVKPGDKLYREESERAKIW